MLRIAICDDVECVCSDIEKIVLSYCKSIFLDTHIDIFYSGNKLLENLLSGNVYDLIMLDIEMDETNGVEVGYKIRNTINDYVTQILYISGNQEYAMQLFQNQPVGFIIKPVKLKDIAYYIDLIVNRLKDNNICFDFHIGKEYYRIQYKDILYFEAQQRKLKIVTLSQTYYTYEKLNNVMDDLNKHNLNKADFILVHRSFLVNYAHIYKYSFEQVVMDNGDTITIGRNNRKNVKKFIFLRGEDIDRI